MSVISMKVVSPFQVKSKRTAMIYFNILKRMEMMMSYDF